MKISFKNYKSFSQKSEFELRKFNILIGPNSSGKSSLAEIISYFIDVRLQQTKFYSENFNIDRYLTNPNALSGSTFTENEGFEPHAVFPKYYKMNNVDNFKNIEFDVNGVNKDEYTNNQKYFFGFKDYKKFSDIFPDKIHMTYPLKARVHRSDLNTRDQWISRQERSDFTTNELLKNCDFYTKPDLFSNVKSLENKDIINSVDTFAVQLDKYISQLENHPEKTRGITNHEINVKYGKNFTQYSFLSKEPFLTGLNVINDKNSDESFIFHQDGTKIFNLIENTVFKLTKQVFKSELDSLENRFLPYKNRLFELFPNDRQYDYHLTMPLPIDKSKWDTSSIESIIDIVVGNTKDNTVVNAVEKPRNLWNHSPYLNSYYYYKSSSSNRRIDNVISGILPPLDGIRPKSVLSKVNTLNAYSQRFDERMNSNQRRDLFLESPTNFFEWNDKFVNRRHRRFERRFTDYDFYKDFCLTKQSSSPRTVLNNLNKDFYHPTSKSKAIQPGYGAFFALTQPTLRMAKIKEDFETFDTIRRDLVSDTDEIIDFLQGTQM